MHGILQHFREITMIWRQCWWYSCFMFDVWCLISSGRSQIVLNWHHASTFLRWVLMSRSTYNNYHWIVHCTIWPIQYDGALLWSFQVMHDSLSWLALWAGHETHISYLNCTIYSSGHFQIYWQHPASEFLLGLHLKVWQMFIEYASPLVIAFPRW